jgi:PKD repeat protein
MYELLLLYGRNGFRSTSGSSGKTTTPVADFTGTPLSGAAPLSVAFTDASDFDPFAWSWEKNDGSGWVPFAGTPTAQNPTESFAAGTWSVRVTATNAGGSDTKTRAAYVLTSSIIAHAVGTGGTGGATTPAINTTGANLLVAAVSGYAVEANNLTLVDSKGNIWTRLTPHVNTNDNQAAVVLFWNVPTSVGTGHTFTSGGAGPAVYSNVAVVACRYAGAASLDAETGSFAGTRDAVGVTTAQPGSLTPSAAGGLLVVGWSQLPAAGADGAAATAVNSGYAILDSADYVAGTAFGVGLAILVPGTLAAANPTVTFPEACSVALAAAAFKTT